MQARIYFDFNATTPPDPRVIKVMTEVMESAPGNPSSVHHLGRQARCLLDSARSRMAKVLGCTAAEVIFTSGGTESNNLAVLGGARALRHKGRHLITSPIEHESVLASFRYLAEREGFELTLLPVDAQGVVDPADLRRVLRPDTVLVSVMAANNEIGTLEPIAELGALCRDRDILFHTDAAQWFGKEPFAGMGQFNADLVTLCSHKFHGPKGTGVLFVRSGVKLQPLALGGGHEQERRAGTENLPAIAGLAEAAEHFIDPPVFPATHLRELTGRLVERIQNNHGNEARLVSRAKDCLSNTVAFTFKDCDSMMLLAGLDLEGVCASSGSACSAGALTPSHVLLGLGLSRGEASSLVRFSLGRTSTAFEVDRAAAVLRLVAGRIRQGRPGA